MNLIHSDVMPYFDHVVAAERFLAHSHFSCFALSMQKVKGIIKNSGQLDAQLELKVISSCLEELKEFPKR